MANYTRFKLRGDTRANLLSYNPVLGLREPVIEIDTRRVKFGDGVSAYSQLPYGMNTAEYASLYNVTSLYPLPSGYYSSTDARLAIPVGERLKGLILTYETASGVWYTERYIGTNVSDWATESNWEKIPNLADITDIYDVLDQKVDIEVGKSLLSDTEIAKLLQYPIISATPTMTKYLRDDGTFSTIAVGSGGYAANVYFNSAASDVSGYKSISYNNDSTQTTVFGNSSNNSETLIEEFIAAVGLNTDTIDAGTWRFNLNGFVSNTNNNTFAVAKVYIRAANGTERFLFSVDSEPVNETTAHQILFESVQPIFIVSPTDRLLIKLYVRSSATTARTLTVNIGGSTPSYVNTPLAIRHTQLRAPNEDPNVQHMTSANKTAVDSLTNGNYQLKSEKNQANGYSGLDSESFIDNRQMRKAFGYKLGEPSYRITIPNNPLLNFVTSGFSIETTFVQNDSTGTQYLVQKTFGNINRWGCRVNSGILYFTLHNGVNFVDLPTLYKVEIGKTNHVIYTVNGDYAYVYFNGNLVARGVGYSSFNFDNLSDVIIGGGGTECFKGNIISVRIFKRGFSQSDVDYYYNMGRPDLSRLTYSDKINKATDGCVVELLPENATASKWLDTQNNLDGITSGNPSVNYGNVVPELYVEPFKKYIGFRKNGDGSGYAVYALRPNKSGKAIIRGGNFVNASDLSVIGDEIQLYKDVSKGVCIQQIDDACELEIDNLVILFQNSTLHTVNSPLPFINACEICDNLSVTNSLANFIYGRVSDIPRTVTSLRISTGGAESISGQFRDLPRNIKEILYLNNCVNIIGNIRDLPRNIQTIVLYTTPAGVVGNIKDLPKSLNGFEVTGSAVLSGNVGEIQGTMSILVLANTSADYTYSGRLNVVSNFARVTIRPTNTAWTSAMTDQLLIDLAAQITSATGGKIIELTGNCGTPTAASSAARAYLAGLGFSVTTN